MTGLEQRPRVSWVVLAVLCGCGLLHSSGEPPSVEHLFPAGFTRGTASQGTVAGKLEPWPPKAWVSCPGVTFAAATNKGQFQIEVSAQAPVGAHLFRLFNEDGSSPPRILVVAEKKEILEQEPNDHFNKAQAIAKLPATVNGRLEKSGDVDSFAVGLEAGQWLEAQLDCYTLGSKVDPLLRLVTPDGVQQAWNHDFLSLDPRLAWQAPTGGTYIVQVMGFKFPADSEVRLTGGEGCVYRLHLHAHAQAPALITGGLPESEPNNTAATAPLLTLPVTVRGTIGWAGDEDYFGFALGKDETVDLNLEAASLGSPLDAWVKIVDAQGKELARNEEFSRFHDPHLEWKATTNGTFYAAVGSPLHKGGTDYGYRLGLQRRWPDYRASVATDAITLTAGETNELKLTVTRLAGFDRKLMAQVHGLPAGVHAEPVAVSPKSGETVVKLVAQGDAKPAQGPIHILLSDPVSSEQRLVPFSLVSASENNGVPGGYTRLLVESTDQLWLTLKAKPVRK